MKLTREWWSKVRYGEPVVVVSGLPRSGTSMMMRMLHAGGLPVLTDGKRDADIDNPNGYFELERVKHLETERDKSYLREARGKAVKVISYLLKFLPDDNFYRVIFMRRDLDELLQSQAKMIQRLGAEDAQASAEALKEAYRNDIVRARLLCKKRKNFALIEVSYRAAVERPREAAAAVSTFVQRPLDIEAMCRAVDGALYRNRAG